MTEGAERQTVVVADFTSLRITRLLSAMTLNAFWAERRGPRDQLIRAIFERLPRDCLLETDASVESLRQWLGLIEESIRGICGTESKQLWLHLSRRIRPEPATLGVSPETAWLARTTLNLAILKYGQVHGRPFSKVGPGADLRSWVEGPDDAAIEPQETVISDWSFLPRTLTTADCLLTHQLEELAYDFVSAATALRRAWKGGRLEVAGGTPRSVILDDETQKLVQLYDERMTKYHTILSGFGLVANLDDALKANAEKRRLDADWLMWLPSWNLDGVDVATMFSEKPDGPFFSNYVVSPVSMESWHRSAKLFDEEIESVWGIRSEQIVAFLVSSSQRHFFIAREDVRLKYQIWQRGYVVIDAERYPEQIAELYQGSCADLFGREISLDEATGEAAQVLAALTYGDADFGAIDLWTRSGAKIVHPMPEGLHLDYSMVPAFLADVLRALPIIGGNAAVTKGNHFEHQAKAMIADQAPTVTFWETPTELKFDDGSERELDLGVIDGELLYVCECKSHIVPPGFERGEPDELWHREEKLRSAFKQANTLAEKLANNPRGRNFTLPEGVRGVIPCVLTPFPEYLPSSEDTYFFETDWPRMCVPEEFAAYLRGSKATTEPGSEYCHEVTEPVT